jgi:hypothetical protein
MDSVGTVQRLLVGKPGGGSERGRPRIRWKDDVDLDFNKSVKRWRTRALNRTDEEMIQL